MTQEEKIKDLEQRLAMVDADNSALCTDIEHWKKVAAGLKGRNKQLSEQLKHYKELDLEGDELNEKRIAEIEENDKVINGLQAQVQELAAKNAELVSKLNANQDLIDELEITVAELKTPWWKKIFS
jgi:chromosome segregation ATPase